MCELNIYYVIFEFFERIVSLVLILGPVCDRDIVKSNIHVSFDRSAIDVEAVVKEHGATPATIGILNGKIHIGLCAFLSKSRRVTFTQVL